MGNTDGDIHYLTLTPTWMNEYIYATYILLLGVCNVHVILPILLLE